MGGLRTAIRHTAAGLSLVAAAVALVALSAGSAPASEHSLAVYPIVECVSASSNTYTAVWGYNNQTGVTQTLAVGTLNNFLPTPQNRGQPTTFNPGRVDNVFSASWTGSSGYLYWELNNQNGAVASASSPACSKPPVPVWTAQTFVWLVVALLGVAIAWRLGWVPSRLGRRLRDLTIP